MEFIIVTGMSGAGKSKVIDALEDIGYFCVDNIPPHLLCKFADLHKISGGSIDKIAVVVDSRGRDMFRNFLSSLDELRKQDIRFRLLFLDADDTILLKRYKEGRRKHPLLDGSGIITIEEAIRLERTLLASARQRADYVIDTSQMAVSQLKERTVNIFMEDASRAMLVHCMSFGFKNGLPSEADLVFDVRCLPNPFYVPELKEHTGLEKSVHDYVMQFAQSRQLLEKLMDLLDFLLPLYMEEGKSQLVVAIGCTGGKHRSVVFAQELSRHISQKNVHVIVNHRDKDKQNLI